MTTHNELCLEQKINLIQEKENGLSHRLLSENFHISIGAVSNILNIHFIHILKLFLLKTFFLILYMEFTNLMNINLFINSKR